jgi:hypothetical protein
VSDDPTTDVSGPTIEQLADIERARRDLAEQVETLVTCPQCAGCGCCGGLHMVSQERADAWRRASKP